MIKEGEVQQCSVAVGGLREHQPWCVCFVSLRVRGDGGASCATRVSAFGTCSVYGMDMMEGCDL